MKTKAIRLKNCNHCKKEFVYSRTDQKFCCVSCRSASFSMRKRAGTVKPLRGIAAAPPQINVPSIPKNEPPKPDYTELIKQDLSNKDLLKIAGIAALVPLSIELIKTYKGVNDKDQMIILKKIHDDQITMNNNIIAIYKLIAQQSKEDKKADWPNNHISGMLGN